LLRAQGDVQRGQVVGEVLEATRPGDRHDGLLQRDQRRPAAQQRRRLRGSAVVCAVAVTQAGVLENPT
jgi:hypothetical protein